MWRTTELALILDTDSPLVKSRETPNCAIVLINDEGVIIHDHIYFDEHKTFDYDRGIPIGNKTPPAHQKNWN